METTNIDESVVARLQELHPRSIPQHLKKKNPVRRATDFDPNTYFNILTHLSMKNGYVLDYKYQFDSNSHGSPWLYARLAGEVPLKSVPVHTEKIGEEESCLLPFLVADGSPDGFFQLVVFLRLSGQFYLFWHSLYNDIQILTGPQDIERLIVEHGSSFTEEQVVRLSEIDARPTVGIADDKVWVTYCTFTRWGGFKLFRDCFRRFSPHHLLERQVLEEMEYHCSFFY